MQPTQEREQNQARLNYAERQGGKELLNRRLSEQELSLLKLFLRTKRRKAKAKASKNTSLLGAPVKPCVYLYVKDSLSHAEYFYLTQSRKERRIGESLRPRCRPCRRRERASVATTAGLSA